MKNTKTKILVEGAVMVALATILSYLRIVKFPWGGAITVLSMLPIVVFALRYGYYRTRPPPSSPQVHEYRAVKIDLSNRAFFQGVRSRFPNRNGIPAPPRAHPRPFCHYP